MWFLPILPLITHSGGLMLLDYGDHALLFGL